MLTSLVHSAQDAAAEGAAAQELTDDAHSQQDPGVADALEDAVKERGNHAVLVGESLRTAQDDAVHHDQGDEHAQRVGQIRQECLNRQVHAGHEAGDHHDEHGDTDLIRDDLPHSGNNDVGQGQDDGNRHTHADAVEERGGDGHGRAHAQHLNQNGVLRQHTVLELFTKIHTSVSSSLNR